MGKLLSIYLWWCCSSCFLKTWLLLLSVILGLKTGSRSEAEQGVVILFVTGAAVLSLLVIYSWFPLIVQTMITCVGCSSALLLGKLCSMNRLQHSGELTATHTHTDSDG